MNPLEGDWESMANLGYFSYTCGFCGEKTGVREGYTLTGYKGWIYICGGCNRPTYIEEENDLQVPGPIFGKSVEFLSPEV